MEQKRLRTTALKFRFECFRGLYYDRLVYQDCSSFGRPSSDWGLIIPFNTTLNQDVLAGTYNVHQAYLENVHEASFTQMSSTDDCVLQVSI